MKVLPLSRDFFGPVPFCNGSYGQVFVGTFVETDNSMTVHINKHGFRGPDFELEKKPHDRIVVIGDSFTFGVVVEDDQTYSAQLEHVLNDRMPTNQVINAGWAGGTSPDAYYTFLAQRGLNFRPDTIVIGMFVWNDVTDLFENRWLETDQYGLPTRLESKARRINERGQLVLKPGQRGAQYVYAPPFPLLNDSHLYSLAMRVYHRLLYEWTRLTEEEIIYQHEPNYIFGLYTIHKPPYPPKLEDKFQVTLKLLEGMKRFTDMNGINLWVVLIPTDAQVHPEMWTKWQGSGAKGPLEPTSDGLDQPQARLVQFLRENGIHYLDLLPEFRKAAASGTKLYFPIDGHWNVEGHRLAAESLAKAILAQAQK